MRYVTIADYSDITKTKPEKGLVVTRKKTGGRNHYGRVTARGIGGGHKQKIRLVDFKRNKHGVEATVAAIEYDPMRSARLALLQYKDGEKTLHHRAGGHQGRRHHFQRAGGSAGNRQCAAAQDRFRLVWRFITSN